MAVVLINRETQDRIDLEQLLRKVNSDHLSRSMSPDTYPADEREKNLLVIERLAIMIEVFTAVRNGTAQEVIRQAEEAIARRQIGKKAGVEA